MGIRHGESVVNIMGRILSPERFFCRKAIQKIKFFPPKGFVNILANKNGILL
jgi:hypothetical protein